VACHAFGGKISAEFDVNAVSRGQTADDQHKSHCGSEDAIACLPTSSRANLTGHRLRHDVSFQNPWSLRSFDLF
jgi:hypothetical protein